MDENNDLKDVENDSDNFYGITQDEIKEKLCELIEVFGEETVTKLPLEQLIKSFNKRDKQIATLKSQLEEKNEENEVLKKQVKIRDIWVEKSTQKIHELKETISDNYQNTISFLKGVPIIGRSLASKYEKTVRKELPKSKSDFGDTIRLKADVVAVTMSKNSHAKILSMRRDRELEEK